MSLAVTNSLGQEEEEIWVGAGWYNVRNVAAVVILLSMHGFTVVLHLWNLHISMSGAQRGDLKVILEGFSETYSSFLVHLSAVHCPAFSDKQSPRYGKGTSSTWSLYRKVDTSSVPLWWDRLAARLQDNLWCMAALTTGREFSCRMGRRGGKPRILKYPLKKIQRAALGPLAAPEKTCTRNSSSTKP